MTIQYKPMRWPPDRVVDWADASDRHVWVAELRAHIFDLFAVAVGATERSRSLRLPREAARESLFANKLVIDQMLVLAGAPLEVWREMFPAVPPPRLPEPPEIALGWPSPFKYLPRGGFSMGDQEKCLGYVEGQLELIVAMLLLAYPPGRDEHRRARWAVIRLKVLFDKLRRALCLGPSSQ